LETNTFKGRLKELGLTKAAFARKLGLSSNAVWAWGEKPPTYAVVCLELLLEKNRAAIEERRIKLSVMKLREALYELEVL
jgi:hypothetical protein